MRDGQVSAFLQRWNGPTFGVLSSGRPMDQRRLSSVLEAEEDWLSRHPGMIPADFRRYIEKYQLSPTACLGILRRAGARGRKLPPALEAALRERAGAASP